MWCLKKASFFCAVFYEPSLDQKPQPSDAAAYPLVAMQLPTLRNLKVRSISNAHRVLYAVARTLLPLITQRLNTKERRVIIAGDVYIWEERVTDTKSCGPSIGMERWTDGMLWGPSRALDVSLMFPVS